MKNIHLWITVLLFAGCLFDNSNTQVAGGEDFPNTIAPLGKVAADNISAHSTWDQFASIDTTPNLSLDSLTSVNVAAAKFAAKYAVSGRTTGSDTTVTVKRTLGDVTFIEHVKISTGDGSLNTKADNRVKEYDVLRSRGTDTLEWTQLVGAKTDSALWGAGDSGLVLLNRQVETPLSRPQVQRLWATLKARITQRGKYSVILSYSERCLLRNGDTTLFAAKGVRGDSSLMASDTSLVTYVQNSSNVDSPSKTRARYWIKMGKLIRPFSDNALLRFEVVNQWNSGILRYDSIGFVPDAPVLSGHPDIHGSFTVSAEDQTGGKSQVKGVFRNDSIQANMRENRNGVNKDYHMTYDRDGVVKTTKDTLFQAKDTVSDHDGDDVPTPQQFGSLTPDKLPGR